MPSLRTDKTQQLLTFCKLVNCRVACLPLDWVTATRLLHMQVYMANKRVYGYCFNNTSDSAVVLLRSM